MDQANELNERINTLRSGETSELNNVYLDTYQRMATENLTKCKASKYECEIRRNSISKCFAHPVTETNYEQVQQCYTQHSDCWDDIRDGSFSSDKEQICNNLRSEETELNC